MRRCESYLASLVVEPSGESSIANVGRFLAPTGKPIESAVAAPTRPARTKLRRSRVFPAGCRAIDAGSGKLNRRNTSVLRVMVVDETMVPRRAQQVAAKTANDDAVDPAGLKAVQLILRHLGCQRVVHVGQQVRA